MINLATIPIPGPESFAEIRGKIFSVSRNLGYSEVEAGRFATAWSLIIRDHAGNFKDAAIALELSAVGAEEHLVFRLDAGEANAACARQLIHCCDTVDAGNHGDAFGPMVASKKLPPLHPALNDAFLDVQRDILTAKSIFELTAELARKNQELEDHQEDLERTIAERTAKLSESEMRFKGVVNQLPVSIALKDRAGRYELINDSFRKWFVADGSDVVGKQTSDVYPKEVADHLVALDRKILETGELIEDEVIEPFADGEDHTLLITKFPIRDEKGDIVSVGSVETDISERKAMEMELVTAREEAEQAAKTKAEFLATMSHEIRTPMNGVMSMSEILDQTKLTADQRGMTKTIRQSADALLTVINDILDFSKIEAGKLDIERISFDLVDVIESTADLLAPRAEEKSLDFLVDIDPKLPNKVIGDPNRIRQLLLNLASNAIKFTEEGGVEFRVRLTDGAAGGGQSVTVRFEIVDTGIGLTEEQRGKLFQAFTQADTSTSRKFGGTGLGLSICKRLCELMDGEINVDSVPGEGSVFWFELPFEPDGEPLVPEHDLSDARVLLVGYGRREAEVLVRYLGDGGVAECGTALTAFSPAPSIEEALGNLSAAPDLVFINVKPGLHVSRSSIAQLGEIDAVGGRPVVLTAFHGAVSSLSVGDLKREHMALQATLTCPVRLRRVWHMVAVALGRAEINDDAIGQESEPVVYVAPDIDTAHAHEAAILVAEDNETNQIVIRRLLSRLGFAFDIANNGAEALVLYDKHSYGLLLTDFHMPEMDGFELTAAIRAAEAARSDGKTLPIVALTADALPQTEQQCLDAGMNGYLRKPIEMTRFEAVLEAQLPHALALRKIEEPGPEIDPEEAAPSGAPALDPEVFDPAQLEDAFGPFDASAAEFVMDFLGTLEPRVAELTDALEQSRHKDARDVAHALKGSGSSVGAKRFADLMGDIQDMLDADDLATAAEFASVIPDAHDELRAQVEPFCAHFLRGN